MRRPTFIAKAGARIIFRTSDATNRHDIDTLARPGRENSRRNLFSHAATIVNVSKAESIHEHIDPDLLEFPYFLYFRATHSRTRRSRSSADPG